MNGDIGRVARVNVLNNENYGGFERFLRNYSREFINYFGRLLILYDPVSTETYERVDIDVEAPIQTNIERTIKDLMNAIKSISSEASKPLTLIVIPSDVYDTLSEERRNELEGYRLDVLQGLINTEFLTELIREYTRTKSNPNGCALSDRELSELAGELAKLDSGHALIARLIGEELARNNCSAREIKELISKAKGKAEAFIILHINGLFKIHEDPDTAKALVEIFALRRPFINLVRPGDPILTPGIVGLIGEERSAKILYGAEGGELRGWLVIRQHDLIEEAIKKLLICIVSEGEECKELGDALKLWETRGVMESLMEVSEKVSDEDSAVKYFASNYGKKLTNTLKVFSNECWKRVALIIGSALTWYPIVPRFEDLSVFQLEDLRKSVVESLGDALKRCGVDYYLLVDNVIPPLIQYLIYTRALAEAFVNKYNEAIAEIRRVLNIIKNRIKNRSDIYYAEAFYSLGLALIIARAVESGKPIEPSDADAALHIVSLTMQHAISSSHTGPVLSALVPLRDKAPQRYLEVLASAQDILGSIYPDWDIVMYILNEFDYILNKYGDRVKGHAWIPVRAIIASINSIYESLDLCDDYRDYRNTSFRMKLEHIVSRVAGLLNEIDRLNPSLGIIAWAHALLPALDNRCVRALMESVLGIDVVNKKAKEVAGELGRLRVQELIRNKDFMGFVESWLAETDEKAARREILEETLKLKNTWARHKLDDDEPYEAEELFNGAARERREIGDYQNYLDNSNWALRAKAIRDQLAGEDLVKFVDEFRQLYEEAFNVEHSKLTARYLSIVSGTLGNYLVSLALTGNYEKINELLEEHLWVLNADREASVLTRLMLNALLRPRLGLSSKLEGKLGVNPEELINAFGDEMLPRYLPALRVAFGIVRPEDGYEECKSFETSTGRRICRGIVLAAADDSDAVGLLRGGLINYFNEEILENERSGWLRKLGFDTNAMISVFGKLVYGLDGKSLAQLLAVDSSTVRLALMLHALISGNKELAKALALDGAIYSSSKLLKRLYLEAYKECCDLESESFRLALVRLFFYHV